MLKLTGKLSCGPKLEITHSAHQMSFFETPPARRACLVRGWGNLALVLGLFALSFTFDMD